MSFGPKTEPEDVSPFEGIQKNAVLQEVKVFNQMPLDPRKVPMVSMICFTIG